MDLNLKPRAKARQARDTFAVMCEYGFKKLLADQCIFKYSDAKGNTMVFLSYVDDIVFAHNNVKLRDEFFATLNEAWKVTQEGVLDRFLAVNFTRSSDGDDDCFQFQFILLSRERDVGLY